MNLPLFIALRYLKARRSRHIINWISRISVAGIAVGTMALIVILSVFNGLDGLIRSLFGAFDPDIRITAVEGKSFRFDDRLREGLENSGTVARYCEVIEENALLTYRDRQAIATVKGVCDDFTRVSGIDSMIIDGAFSLYQGETPTGVIGYELAAQLGIGLNFINPVHIWVPRRSERLILDPTRAFNHQTIFPAGIFSVQQDYDSKYFIIPADFARELFGYEADELSALEVTISGRASSAIAKTELKELFGAGFRVQDRMEQHAYFYKVMASEKWIIFLIMTFILFIASFNTISSLSLLLLEKKPDMNTLQSLGAREAMVRQVFLWEGILVTGLGLVTGLAVGALICLLQQQFGIIRLPGSGSFVVDAYPVKMIFSDFMMVTLMVGVIGLLASYIPIRIMKRSYFLPGAQDE
ncbi:MAG: FtsX-like permease family protein [Bacteroidales bacterium]